MVEQGGGGHLGIPGTSHNAGSTGDLSSVGKITPPSCSLFLGEDPPPVFLSRRVENIIFFVARNL